MEDGALRRLTSIFDRRCEKRLAELAPPSDQSLSEFAQGQAFARHLTRNDGAGAPSRRRVR
jgi:hypothetical protein